MENIPFWKAILITLGVLVLATAYTYVGSLLGLKDPWIGFVALTLWSATGMKMEQAPGIFVGGAVGLLISLGIESSCSYNSSEFLFFDLLKWLL